MTDQLKFRSVRFGNVVDTTTGDPVRRATGRDWLLIGEQWQNHRKFGGEGPRLIIDGSDADFVLSSWLKSAGDAWTTLRSTDAGRFQGVPIGWFADVPHRFTRAAVAEILDRPATRTVVACDPDDHGLIYGYAVAEPASRVVHWLHVKHTLRRNGLATDLLTRLVPQWRDGVTCTYLGRGFLGWAAKYPIHFNPHAGR